MGRPIYWETILPKFIPIRIETTKPSAFFEDGRPNKNKKKKKKNKLSSWVPDLKSKITSYDLSAGSRRRVAVIALHRKSTVPAVHRADIPLTCKRDHKHGVELLLFFSGKVSCHAKIKTNDLSTARSTRYTTCQHDVTHAWRASGQPVSHRRTLLRMHQRAADGRHGCNLESVTSDSINRWVGLFNGGTILPISSRSDLNTEP